jgi:predicted AAA+ superfamily ATPase
LPKDNRQNDGQSVAQLAWAEVAQRLLTMLPVSRDIDWQQSIAGYWRRGRWSSSIVGFEETGVVSLDNLLHVDAQKKIAGAKYPAIVGGSAGEQRTAVGCQRYR